MKYDGSEELDEEDEDAEYSPLAGAVFQLLDGTTVVNLVKVSDTEYRVATTAEVAAYNSGTPADFTATSTIANDAVVSNFKTVATDKITITGVDSDSDHTYSLVEVEAPAGYNKLDSAKSITVDSTNALVSEIENNTGTVLPSTGGIGTTIFYVIGAILVIGAGVVLVSRRRMNSAE